MILVGVGVIVQLCFKIGPGGFIEHLRNSDSLLKHPLSGGQPRDRRLRLRLRVQLAEFVQAHQVKGRARLIESWVRGMVREGQAGRDLMQPSGALSPAELPDTLAHGLIGQIEMLDSIADGVAPIESADGARQLQRVTLT